MIIDITPRLPYRASPELMEIYRARLMELLEAQEPPEERPEGMKRRPDGQISSLTSSGVQEANSPPPTSSGMASP